MGITTKKSFWTFNKPFLKKRFLENNDITLTEEYKVITIKRELAKTFDKHYINIVERSSGIKPKDLQVWPKSEYSENNWRNC